MQDLITELAYLLDGILHVPDFQMLHESDEGFRVFISDALHLYEECREEIRIMYGADGVRTYNDALRGRARRLQALIPKGMMEEVAE